MDPLLMKWMLEPEVLDTFHWEKCSMGRQVTQWNLLLYVALDQGMRMMMSGMVEPEVMDMFNVVEWILGRVMTGRSQEMYVVVVVVGLVLVLDQDVRMMVLELVEA